MLAKSGFVQPSVEGLVDVSISACWVPHGVHTIFDNTKVVGFALQDTLQIFQVVSYVLLLTFIKGHGIVDALVRLILVRSAVDSAYRTTKPFLRRSQSLHPQ